MTMLPTAPVAVGGGIIEQEDHLTVSDITMPNAAEVDDPEDPVDGITLSRSVGLGRPGPNLLASENRKPGASPAGNGIPSVETNPANDPLSTQHKWTIENFSKITARKKYSEPFEIGLHKWRLLIFPKGNQTENLAIYLDVAEASELPPGWSREAEFCLSLVNQRDPTLTVKKDTNHKFSSKECDWGFTSFMPLGELYEQGKGFLVKDTVIIEASVSIRQDYWAWDSKKATGYVGLKNQGATCYMNSLLQTLYHIPYFRKAVYHMPTTENDEAATSLAVALQSLFYKLQYSDTSVSTKDLTKSFGWDAFDSFMQHDVQELNRVLCEKLEDKMKGTSVEGTIEQLFEGHHMNTIECINVEYKSDRKESFYDLQLDVKGCADVYASFDKYTEVEELVGDNKYAAEQHGLQDARKGVSFLDFPPVLQLQLKRFEYDFIRDTMVKINDRYAFPLHLDLEREEGRYLAPGADRSVPNCYTLHSVLVHSGGVHGGHYYAYIAPALDHRWFKFDDERVTGEEARRALDEQYGGGEELKFTNHSNAYMLVYVRDADRDTILCPVDSSDIAEHLEVRLKREQEEKERKKKEKAEAHLYTVIKVATDADLKDQIGRTLYFDLVDHDRVRSFRVPKQTTFAAFKEEVALELKVALPAQRFWSMAKRKNHTFRPSQPLTPAQEAMQVGAVKEGTSAEVRLYLEGEPWRERVRNEVLLFCKLYDPLQESLSYAGKLSVSLACKPSDLVEQLCALAGYAGGTQLLLFEEVRSEPVMCERMDMEVALKASSMEDGDILCFQRHLGVEEAQAVRYPCVDAFLSYVRYRQVVHFRRLEKPGEEVVTLELSMRNTYDEVTEQLALKLGLADPTLLRLTLHNCYSCVPRPPALKYRGVERLENMLVHYNQTADIVYFEVLNLPLPDLERLKTLNLAFHNLRGEEVGTHSLRLPKTSTVGDVLKEVRGRVEVSHPEAQLRLLEIFDHKIYKIFPTSDPIENINDHYWRLRAEEIPIDQQQSDHRLLHVYHFSKEGNAVVHNFGDPLLLTLSATESVGELKGRIQRQLAVAEEEFAQWGVALVSLGHAEYLKDTDLLTPRLPKKDTCGAWEHYLGLEHTDTAPRKHHHIQHRQGYGYEKAVKIYN